MERDHQRMNILSTPVNFNSHAHVERDNRSVNDISNYQISTHTLTWSVTTMFNVVKFILMISTHTLTWSVTIIIVSTVIIIPFQLTRSRGA